jgi:hypothetical protein
MEESLTIKTQLQVFNYLFLKVTFNRNKYILEYYTIFIFYGDFPVTILKCHVWSAQVSSANNVTLFLRSLSTECVGMFTQKNFHFWCSNAFTLTFTQKLTTVNFHLSIQDRGKRCRVTVLLIIIDLTERRHADKMETGLLEQNDILCT